MSRGMRANLSQTQDLRAPVIQKKTVFHVYPPSCAIVQWLVDLVYSDLLMDPKIPLLFVRNLTMHDIQRCECLMGYQRQCNNP
jgi:hypothetical protein